jgi:hypothetical protein
MYFMVSCSQIVLASFAPPIRGYSGSAFEFRPKFMDCVTWSIGSWRFGLRP